MLFFLVLLVFQGAVTKELVGAGHWHLPWRWRGNWVPGQRTAALCAMGPKPMHTRTLCARHSAAPSVPRPPPGHLRGHERQQARRRDECAVGGRRPPRGGAGGADMTRGGGPALPSRSSAVRAAHCTVPCPSLSLTPSHACAAAPMYHSCCRWLKAAARPGVAVLLRACSRGGVAHLQTRGKGFIFTGDRWQARGVFVGPGAVGGVVHGPGVLLLPLARGGPAAMGFQAGVKSSAGAGALGARRQRGRVHAVTHAYTPAHWAAGRKRDGQGRGERPGEGARERRALIASEGRGVGGMRHLSM
jgi:hypothetical protein